MPGTFVAIGLNSPRYSAGASGFGSKVSRWLGPPARLMKIAEVALAPLDLAGLGQAEVIGQAQAGRAEHADAEEVAPPDAVAVSMGRHALLRQHY